MKTENLKTKLWDISKLVQAEYNPRVLKEHQYKQLKDSIERFGIVDPILVNVHPDRHGIIIGGHQRTFVAEKMGIKKVPCVELSLTLEQEKELNIRLNKNTGEWDWENLANYFDQTELIDWGFSQGEVSFFNMEDIDYGILDDEDVSDQIDSMQDGVKKAIQIEFDLEHYEEATELVKYWREQGADVGAMLIDKLKAEKNKNV